MPAQGGRALSRNGRRLRSPTPPRPCSLLQWALESEATLACHGSGEAHMRFGVASRIPECAPDLPIGIYCRSGRRSREIWKLTSSTRKPEANDLGLWTTRPGDTPKCRWQRSRIQYESSQFGRHASSLPKTQQLLTQGFVRDLGSR